MEYSCSRGVCLLESSGKTYFVSLNGSDDNDRSFEAPWKILTYAESQMFGGEILYIREGIYNEKLRVYDFDDSTNVIGDPLFSGIENIRNGKIKREYFELLEDSSAIDVGIIISGLHCSTSGSHSGENCVEWY